VQTNNLSITRPDGRFIQPTAEAVAPIEPEALSRFEGEGGLGAPVTETELIDVPLENAIWRKSPPPAQQPNKATLNLNIKP